MADSIAELKKQLEEQEEIDVTRQRWFFSGKLLTDKTRLQDTKIQKDFVVQVIVNMNAPVIANWVEQREPRLEGKCEGFATEACRNRSRAWNYFSVGIAVGFCVHFIYDIIAFIWLLFVFLFLFSKYSTNIEKHWNTLDEKKLSQDAHPSFLSVNIISALFSKWVPPPDLSFMLPVFIDKVIIVDLGIGK